MALVIATTITSGHAVADDAVSTLLARPLFSASRRPAEAPPAAGQTSAGPIVPRIYGTVLTDGVKRAVFAGTHGPITVAEAGTIGEFHVQLIEPGKVTLIGPDGIHTVLAQFDTTHPDVPVPAIAPAPGAPSAVSIMPASALISGLPDLLPRAAVLGGPAPGAAPMPATMPRPSGTTTGLPSQANIADVLHIPGLPNRTASQ